MKGVFRNNKSKINLRGGKMAAKISMQIYSIRQ